MKRSLSVKTTLLPVLLCDGDKLAKVILKLAIMSYSNMFKIFLP